MSEPTVLAPLIPLVALIATVAWLVGFSRGRRDMRDQIVRSLRFSAALREDTAAWPTKAQALRDEADRIARLRP